jgi:hypothetical protein
LSGGFLVGAERGVSREVHDPVARYSR